jgi:hypothetical protein
VVVVGRAEEDMNLYNNAQAYFSGAPYYITAAWDEEDVYAGRVPARIVVGDGVVYNMVDTSRGPITYTNVELRSNTQYTIFTRYDLMSDDESDVSGG